jgi:hypothetical protein
MKTMLMIAATLVVTMVGGCATYATDYPPDGYYYDVWGSDGGGGKGHSRSSGGGRSEPGNESGMRPGRGGDGRGGATSGGGSSRDGGAGGR